MSSSSSAAAAALKRLKALEPICVTGGSGFLGSWIVNKLLQRQIQVRATTRSRSKAEFLTQLPHASTHLQICDGCDFASPQNLSQAIQGCGAVIHCASPFFNAGGTRANLVDPAIQGTELVLNLCHEHGVQKVTLTSSSASVIVDYGTKAAASSTGNHTYTEADFSPQDILEEKQNWYALSKLLAELKAWELAKTQSYKLCVLNPSLIWGPMVPGQTHLNTSSQAILQYMDGSHSKIQNGVRCVVDVRNVAEAHIVPLEQDDDHPCWASGKKRYLLFGAAPHFQETASHVRQALLDAASNGNDVAQSLVDKVPTQVEDKLQPTVMGPSADKPLLFDNTPAQKDLGIDFYGVQDMVSTCVNELLANGFTGSHQYDPKSL